MKAEFWHERWEKGEIGFHQHEYNRYMQDFVDRLGVDTGDQILVPLCGKSLDMLWLAERGYQVIGIEISDRAVTDFFNENGLRCTIERKPGRNWYRGERIQILCADFFSVKKAELPPIDAIYDRASLIALPEEMRPVYVAHVGRLADRGITSLLVTLDYPQEEMRGPPFSVTPDEVRRLYGAQHECERLHSEDCLAREPRFRKKGLTRLHEHVFLLKKR